MPEVRRHQLVSLVVPLLAAGAVAAVCAGHRHQLAEALRRIPPAVLAGAVALHVVALTARAEAWLATLAAIDGRGAPRRVVHLASAVGFLAGTVSGHATLPLRMVLVRRLAPAGSPVLRDMMVADAPIYAVEATIAAALVPLAAGALGLPLWAALLAPVAGIAVLLVLRRARELAGLRGLAILAAVQRRRRLLALVVAVSACTFARMWLLLGWSALPHGLGDVTLLFVSASALSLLPLGPAAGPAAALLAGGGANVGAAAAVGIGISGSSIAGVALYGCCALLARARPSQPDHAEFSVP